MRLIICTNTNVDYNLTEFAAEMNCYDPSFSQRYVEFNEILESDWLKSEPHRESDKYSLFFLNLDDFSVNRLIEDAKNKEWCNLIGEIDDNYNLKGEPLYISNAFESTPYYQDGGQFKVPSSISRRGLGFKPRMPDNPQP